MIYNVFRSNFPKLPFQIRAKFCPLSLCTFATNPLAQSTPSTTNTNTHSWPNQKTKNKKKTHLFRLLHPNHKCYAIIASSLVVACCIHNQKKKKRKATTSETTAYTKMEQNERALADVRGKKAKLTSASFGPFAGLVFRFIFGCLAPRNGDVALSRTQEEEVHGHQYHKNAIINKNNNCSVLQSKCGRFDFMVRYNKNLTKNVFKRFLVWN